LPERPVELIEPFAGGAIVGLTVAFEKMANHVTLVELDDEVAAVWQTILSDDAEWLAQQVIEFELTRHRVEVLLARDPLNLREKALITLIKNRVNRGGILAQGAGMLKNGESGKGIASRWYPKTLHKRIMDIYKIRDRLTFIHGDGIEVIRHNAGRSNTAFFIDPPYTAAGKSAGRRLYTHWNLDHEELFQVTNELAGEFLLTYEDNAAIRELTARYGFDTQPVAMKNTHHAKMTELLIGRNLDWMREPKVNSHNILPERLGE
jgi:DNA adenine methylase